MTETPLLPRLVPIARLSYGVAVVVAIYLRCLRGWTWFEVILSGVAVVQLMVLLGLFTVAISNLHQEKRML